MKKSRLLKKGESVRKGDYILKYSYTGVKRWSLVKWSIGHKLTKTDVFYFRRPI